jgi:type I restriction enzyme R subunit
VLPALTSAGWNVDTQVREEVPITAGAVIVRGKKVERARILKADYVLFWRSTVPLAVIEAKDNNHALGAGMEQALTYANMLDLPFAISTNGDGFLLRDNTGNAAQPETELTLDAFPSPHALWERYRAWKKLPPEAIPLVEQDFHGADERPPRYYQTVAINRVIEAVARGERRMLLVMATGTGKTLTAFQIAWRLKRAGRVNRVLFVTDRDSLASQTMRGDFAPFRKVMTRIEGQKVDRAYEVYFALYQSLVSDVDAQSAYRKFSNTFFDLVIVDECHRGSAEDDARWRRVLEWFTGAIQLGLTATPRETRTASNTEYFGEPAYTYSLRQGIEDGFLAPYKVIRVDMDRDLQGWRPPQGMRDDNEKPMEVRNYGRPDFDRSLVLVERTRRVAERVVALLRSTDRYAKTLIFCQDIDHATRMRTALVNAAPDWAAESPDYIVRITGDVPEAAALVERLSTPSERYPVIVTTSELLTTGVDVKTCQYVVIDQTIQSMTKFKQLIGRGTRLLASHNKFFFTIVDFKGATRLFEDTAFDGTPVSIYEPDAAAPLAPPDDDAPPEAPVPAPNGPPGFIVSGRGNTAEKYVVGNLPVAIASEQTLHYTRERLVVEALRDEVRRVVTARYPTLDALTDAWRGAERRQTLVDALRDDGVLVSALGDLYDATMDPLDLLACAAFDAPVVTRAWRANHARASGLLAPYKPDARAVLEALIELYEREGVAAVEDPAALKLPALQTLGTVVELVKRFGGRDGFLAAQRALLVALYRDRAESS